MVKGIIIDKPEKRTVVRDSYKMHPKVKGRRNVLVWTSTDQKSVDRLGRLLAEYRAAHPKKENG